MAEDKREERWIEIARIGRPHGVRGELKVTSLNPDSDLLGRTDGLRLQRKGKEPEPIELTAMRPQGDAWLVRIAGVSSREEAAAYTRGWAVNSQVARVRLKAQNDQLTQHVALLTEEIRIKDARMIRIAPQKRPHYVPAERMSILELRAARAWTL